MAALAVLGCARFPYTPARVAQDPALRETLEGRLAERYPAQFRLVQRLALRALGKQYDMLGYLVVSSPDSFRAVALGEMGGRIFDLSLDRGAAAIVKKPERMPPRPLVAGVIEDIRHLFLPPEQPLALAEDAEGAPALIGSAGGRTVEYDFGPPERRLTRSVTAEDGQVVREVVYSGYRSFPGFDVPVPSRIVVENRRWRYTLEVQILEIHPGAAAPPSEAP